MVSVAGMPFLVSANLQSVLDASYVVLTLVSILLWQMWNCANLNLYGVMLFLMIDCEQLFENIRFVCTLLTKKLFAFLSFKHFHCLSSTFLFLFFFI